MVTGGKEAPAPEEGEDPVATDEEAGTAPEGEVPPGVPEFWLNVLRNFEAIGEKVRDTSGSLVPHCRGAITGVCGATGCDPVLVSRAASCLGILSCFFSLSACLLQAGHSAAIHSVTISAVCLS